MLSAVKDPRDDDRFLFYYERISLVGLNAELVVERCLERWRS